MKRILLGTTLFAALLAASTAAVPQDEWTQQVRRMLVNAGKQFESSGYSMTHQIYTGSLRNGASGDVRLQLDIGTEYHIVGQCDNDCSDLDLALYGPSGGQVDSDVLPDDDPVVSVTPGRSGNYRVHVTMAACSAEPCRYGIGVFGR